MNLSYLTGDVNRFLNVSQIIPAKKTNDSKLEAEILAQLAKAAEFWKKIGKIDVTPLASKIELPKNRNYSVAFKHLDSLGSSIDRAEIEYIYNQLMKNN